MPAEHRKHKRFRGKEGAFAVFLRGDDLLCLGGIVDISMGGVCVRYLSTSGVGPDCSRIKIFGSNAGFIHLDRMDCKIVHDTRTPDSSWAQLCIRRCGVRFDSLTVRQTAMLEDFIQHFSQEEDYQLNDRV